MYAVGRITLADVHFQNPRYGRCQLLFDTTTPHVFLNVWVWTNEQVDYRDVVAENMDTIPSRLLPTRFARSQWKLEEVEAVISQMEVDEDGNVNRDELFQRLRDR